MLTPVPGQLGQLTVAEMVMGRRLARVLFTIVMATSTGTSTKAPVACHICKQRTKRDSQAAKFEQDQQQVQAGVR
jgi:hypothetical protein